MTAVPETRYHCDRCHVDKVVPADGSGPPHNRIAGPDDWLMIRIGSDPATVPKHLCPVCKTEFMRWLEAHNPWPADA